jgi:galactokinase
LAEASQREADMWLGNQVPETRALAALARNRGALGACSFGAGFGGSVWAVVATTSAARFASDWQTAYEREFPHRRAECFVARPGPALTEVPTAAAI